MHRLILCLGLFYSVLASADCLTSAQINTLTQQEINFLEQQIPPAFRHAVDSNIVTIAVEPVSSEVCQAKLVINLPQTDIDEANAVLDAQPAKKIMLAAQGYALPQSTKEEAIFNVDETSLKLANSDILQTAPMGKLRASLELMYAFITQNRAQLRENQTNNVAWPSDLTKKVVSDCAEKQPKTVCDCLANSYAQTIPANQMEYIQYIRENPYALATGVNKGFELVNQEAQLACKG